MDGFLEEIKHSEAEYLNLLKVNADKNMSLVKQLNVSHLPTLLIYKNGKLEWRNIGYIKKIDLLEKISNFK